MSKKLLAVSFALVLPACAHQAQTSTEKCTACPPQKECASAESVEETLLIKQRSRAEYDELNELYQKATAWQPRWQDSFKKLKRNIVEALAPEEEDDDESTDGNVENVIKYTIEMINGNMHVTFRNAQLFKPKKAELSKMGIDIVERMTEILKLTPERKITIGSKTTVRNESLGHSEWYKVRELSAKRALAVMAVFEKNDIDPRNLISASLSNRIAEDPLEQGTTVLIFAPIAGEMPRFPDKIQ